jgi:hypothetical protein
VPDVVIHDIKRNWLLLIDPSPATAPSMAVADAPTHLIHFNWVRLLGHYDR